MITDVQARFGDESARSLCTLRGGGGPGHGLWTTVLEGVDGVWDLRNSR